MFYFLTFSYFSRHLEISKYTQTQIAKSSLTPLSSDIINKTTSISNDCFSLCNNNTFKSSNDYLCLTIDTVDSVNIEKTLNTVVYPGQAVKIITENCNETNSIINEEN